MWCADVMISFLKMRRVGYLYRRNERMKGRVVRCSAVRLRVVDKKIERQHDKVEGFGIARGTRDGLCVGGGVERESDVRYQCQRDDDQLCG